MSGTVKVTAESNDTCQSDVLQVPGMNFTQLCGFFETVKTAKGPGDKAAAGKAFFRSCRTNSTADDLFEILRLAVPKLDRDRPSYRIKETKIGRVIIKTLDLPQGNNDRNLLAGGHLIGNFGEVIFSIMRKYIASQRTVVNVAQVNEYLDRIAKRTSDAGLDDLMLEIFQKLSPQDTKWFVNIILRDLHTGIGDNTMLKCFHEDGATYYSTNNSLKKLCEVLADPEVRYNELELTLFKAFRPMLSKRIETGNFNRSFPSTLRYFIENKFDGERFQLHMSDGKFKYFSRNGFDFTDSFGASYAEGSFTPLLKDAFDSDLKSVILDGEMMLWNKVTRAFGSKGMTLDVKKLQHKRYQACFCVFDVLLRNGQVLTNQPVSKRLSLLKKVIKKAKVGTIVVSEHKETGTKEDIIDALNASVDNNEEGIIVKDTKAKYKCGERNGGWFKLKMEYFDDVVHDLDVLVMGASYGANKKFNSFLIGIASGSNYLSLSSISSGLNAEQLDYLTEKLNTHGRSFKEFPTKTSGKLLFGRETPDVYIEPQHSTLLQIRATELIHTHSDAVKTPYTLRFPRVLKIREDKPVDECLTMNELLELTATGQNKSVIKLNKRHIELSEIVKKTAPAKKRKLDVVKLDSKDSGGFLAGHKIHVLFDNASWAKDDVYNSIKRTGGTIAFKLDPDVDLVLVPDVTPKVLSLMANPHHFDIVHTNWLRKVLDSKSCLDYSPEDLLSRGTNYRGDLHRNMDLYNDCFCDEATEASLKRVFEQMNRNDHYSNDNRTVIINDELNKFQNRLAYFDCFQTVNDPHSKLIYDSFLDEIEFQYYKGAVHKRITHDVNLIITQSLDERKPILKEFLKTLGLDIEIAPKQFVYK